jgi:hypothetical protein
LRGFYEVEISRRLDCFGNIAHVFSTFDARYKADDPKPLARGINSINCSKMAIAGWLSPYYGTRSAAIAHSSRVSS